MLPGIVFEDRNTLQQSKESMKISLQIQSCELEHTVGKRVNADLLNGGSKGSSTDTEALLHLYFGTSTWMEVRGAIIRYMFEPNALFLDTASYKWISLS